jgi:hypothetical protein
MEQRSYMDKRKWFASALEAKSSKGSSLNKWLALWCMVLITFLHVKYLHSEFVSKGDFDLIPQFLWCDFTGCALFLGIIHATDIIMLLNRGKGQVDTYVQKTKETTVNQTTVANKED